MSTEFYSRKVLLIVFSLVTVGFMISASQLKVDAGFNKMVPLTHPYMKVYTEYQSVFGGANRIAIALVQKQGDIYNKEFMEKLKGLTKDVQGLTGVASRSRPKSMARSRLIPTRTHRVTSARSNPA